ncbi:uncharacterized protein LOC119401836 [Rhipicephalus sanguineus]|uniref:uncharacterized protein LOC119401836 n=1 Tax=Rhipicephalus sanguineus TaxID=34632 RepID=UPI0020C3F49A|nr:uncharacterized protein LOC119401836 [Rhipicephalus sanguineus]
MIPEGHSYAVYGFSENLDWSTLNFVKPVDDIRVCSACGVVGRKTAFMPCRHVLCEPCYEHWKSIGSHVCFLDGEMCPENEVHWMEFPAEKMMRCEVSCWNRGNGCETIIDVSSIADHFHRDCAYHCTCCPNCSSTVLRRDIIADLESNCTNYVLNRMSRTLPCEDVSKDAQWLREDLHALESTFRNASQNDASLLSSLQGIAAKNRGNQIPIATMADEVELLSQVMRQTQSEVERSSERRVNQSVELRNFREWLCAELDEIERAAIEEWSCERVTLHENKECEEHVDGLEWLQREVQSLSNKLEEVKNKTSHEAGLRKRAAEDTFMEVLSTAVLTCDVYCLNKRIEVKGFAHVIENALKVPVLIFWCVHNWSKVADVMNSNRFRQLSTSFHVHRRYRICLTLACDLYKGGFHFIGHVSKSIDATVEGPPKNMKVVILNRGRRGVEYELDRTTAERTFLTKPFGFEDLQDGRSIQDDKLEVCFKFSY